MLVVTSPFLLLRLLSLPVSCPATTRSIALAFPSCSSPWFPVYPDPFPVASPAFPNSDRASLEHIQEPYLHPDLQATLRLRSAIGLFNWNPRPSGYLVAHPPVSGLWHSATRSPPFPPHVRADTFTVSLILPSWRLQYSSNGYICPCTLFSQLAFPFRHLLFCSNFRLLPLCHPCLTPRVFFTFAPSHPPRSPLGDDGRLLYANAL